VIATNELTKQALYHSFNSELYHYGKEGMRWGFRRYQPYSQGYDAERRGIFLGSHKSKNAYRYTDGKDAMSYLTGKRSAYDEVRRGGDAAYAIKQKLKAKASDAKSSFDKWNRSVPQYSEVAADRLKKDTIRLQNEASSWKTKLYEAQDQARKNAMRRSFNEQTLAENRGDRQTAKRIEEERLTKGYDKYYTDRENEIISSLERIASKYQGKSDLAARRYFRYEERGSSPQTKLGQYEQAIKNRLEDAKSYIKSYGKTFAKLMTTDVSDIPDASSRMKYQKQIDDITKKAFKMRSAQNLTAAMKQSRMDIDKDLVAYFSGQREILPVESIAAQFFGKSIFEYDAD
jgi:hypothetical protein